MAKKGAPTPPPAVTPENPKIDSKVGRPRVEINEGQFESLCGFHLTLEEIASFFKCHQNTVEAWCVRTYGENFSKVYKSLSAYGKMSLKHAMWNKAIAGDNVMMIWLSKQYLGFRNDPPEGGTKEIPSEVKIIWQDAQPQIGVGSHYDTKGGEVPEMADIIIEDPLAD